VNNNLAGAVWVFTRSGGVWTQQGPRLVGTGSVAEAEQGWSVAISSDGNTAIEGGSGDNNQVGAVWVFTRNGVVWTQQGTKLVGTGAAGNSKQGSSVAISTDGGTVIEGGPNDDGAGAVWVFYNPTVSVSTISQEVPQNFSLSQNYPNPFNPATLIKYSLSKTSKVKITIYDILGRETETVLNEQLDPGNYEVRWDGTNYSSGVYFYRIVTDGFAETRKMILMK
jgi:hypothetical protein